VSLRIITVGKKHESWINEGVERYQKRLRAPYDVEWVLLPHSRFDGTKARLEESEDILSRIKPTDVVILMDEGGRMFNSIRMAEELNKRLVHSASVVFVIGGAYGVSDALHARASLVWSLSPLVFPHQLVRLVLVEQIYRMQNISAGGAYHHE